MQKLTLFIFSITMIFSTSTYAAVVKVFPGSIGAEIIEMDLSCGMKSEEVELIRHLVHDRLVVVIRNQNLTAQQQVSITKQFGDIEIAWDKKNRHPDDCRVHVIKNDRAILNPNYVSSTYFWHWDKSFIRYPTSFSFAFFPSDPQPEGIGTTGFLNAYTAYQRLPEALKVKIEHLNVTHSYNIMSDLRKQNYKSASLEFEQGSETFPDVVHSLVRIHPSTAKRTLNIDELSQGNILGMEESQSTELKKTLFDQAMQNGDFYYHNWKTGDFVIWDNLALIHRGTPNDPTISRILHRTNVSSRSDYEGKCILVGSDVSLDSVVQKLFTEPLILDSDSYYDLDSLEADVLALRSGHSIENHPPHAIVIVQGERWKESQILTSTLHVCLLQDSQESKYRCVIGFSEDCGEKLEKFCLEYFLTQDSHERLLSGELSRDHLEKKWKILVSSYDTYSDLRGEFSDQRNRTHAKIFARAFENTPLKKTENQWFEYLQTIKHQGLLKMRQRAQEASVSPSLLFLGGGQGSGKTTLLGKLKKDGTVREDTVIINSRLFFDFLFQDVPYSHKVRLWPYFSKEKQYLTVLIAKIAMAHQIPVVVDTHILTLDFCQELTEAVKEFGGTSTMLALYKPLDLCYFHEQQSAESHLEQSHQLIYEQMMFHKLFTMNWNRFVSQFDRSFLIDQMSDQIIFFSDKDIRLTSSLDHLKQFLSIGSIDPDELASKLVSKSLTEGVQIIRDQMAFHHAKESAVFSCTEMPELNCADLKMLQEF